MTFGRRARVFFDSEVIEETFRTAQSSCAPRSGETALRALSQIFALAPRTLTLASNRTTAGPMLEQILLRARLQLLGHAYVHHFERYGVEADFIAERAEIVQRVVDDYEGVRGGGKGAAAR